MKQNWLRWVFLGIMLFFWAIAGWITLETYRQIQTREVVLPGGTKIGGVALGGLTVKEADERLTAAYQTPVELHYQNVVIQVRPEQVGFQLDVDGMIAQVLPEKVNFWQALWGKEPIQTGKELPLIAQVDEKVLGALLMDIDQQLGQKSSPAQPIWGTTRFSAGDLGIEMDFESAVPLVKAAFLSLEQRTVDLPVKNTPAQGVSAENLQKSLEVLIRMAGFNGLAEIYLQPMGEGEKLHFAVQDYQIVPGDIAFTAASTIKIPVLVATCANEAEPHAVEVDQTIAEMILYSDNPSTDVLMERLDSVRGPLIVTEKMRALGLENTFISGYFYLGAPLLDIVQTPANQRTDIFLQPDMYNQTTAADIGQLLTDIVQCAENNTGPLVDVLGGSISQAECQSMLDVLRQNKIARLIESGVPEGTPVAHKHGWIEETDGYLHTMSDVGVVFSPSQTYVLTIFLYHPTQLVFLPADKLVAQLSQTIYNAYNLEKQEDWIFGEVGYPGNQ